ncbi:MAG: pirin family protein [Candidatus Micrarchaeota archaeon]
MRIPVRSSERFHSKEDWLETNWHFSFGHYHDPHNMGWGVLRVFNDDRIAPGGKFDLHPHANYEIMTVVLEGALEHTDSGGHKGILRADGVQAMSAGSGVFHSEANTGKTAVHSLQIWIEPEKKGGAPAWKSQPFRAAGFHNELCALVSGVKTVPAPLSIRQKAVVYRSRLDAGRSITHSFPGAHGYLFVISGELKADGIVLSSGDSLKLEDEKKIRLEAGKAGADLILFDLP